MIKTKKIKEYLKKTIKTIAESLKPEKKIFKTLATDLILLLIIAAAIIYYNNTTLKTYQQLETLMGANTIEQIMESQPGVIGQGIKEILYATYTVIACVLILWIISRTIVHSIMHSQKMFTKQNLKFLGINTLSTTLFLLIAYATIKIIKDPISYFTVIITAILYVHLKQIFYQAATHKKSIKQGIKAIITTGIGKANHFILPTIAVIIMFFLVNITAALISRLALLAPKTTITSTTPLLITARAILCLISWTRNYWIKVINNIKV